MRRRTTREKRGAKGTPADGHQLNQFRLRRFGTSDLPTARIAARATQGLGMMKCSLLLSPPGSPRQYFVRHDMTCAKTLLRDEDAHPLFRTTAKG